MRKLRFVFLALAALFLVTGSLAAQEKVKKEKKKVVIIKETVDEDGNVVKEKIIKEGDDVKGNVWHSKEGDEKVVIIREGDGTKTIKVIVEGDEEGFDMEELEDEMEKTVSVTVEEGEGNKNMVIRIKGADGEVETIKWQGEEGGMPEGLLEELEDEGIRINILHEDDDEHMLFLGSDKPFLGVVASQTKEISVQTDEDGEVVEEIVEKGEDRGALISDVVAGSAAEAAGLKGGDVITKINDDEVNDFGDLSDAMEKYEVGDKVTISYLRDGKAMETSATLKAYSGLPEDLDFEWTDEEDGHIFIRKAGEKGENIFIEIEEEDGVKEKKVIIKKKKKSKSKED